MKPKTPLFIGLEIPTANGVLKVFIGIDQEDGNEINFTTEADIQEAEKTGNPCWLNGAKMSVLRGTEGRVFDDKHNLIQFLDQPNLKIAEKSYPTLVQIVKDTPNTVIDDVWEDIISLKAFGELKKLTGLKTYKSILKQFEGDTVEELLEMFANS